MYSLTLSALFWTHSAVKTRQSVLHWFLLVASQIASDAVDWTAGTRLCDTVIRSVHLVAGWPRGRWSLILHSPLHYCQQSRHCWSNTITPAAAICLYGNTSLDLLTRQSHDICRTGDRWRQFVLSNSLLLCCRVSGSEQCRISCGTGRKFCRLHRRPSSVPRHYT